MCRQEFSCEPDALAAMARFERQLKTHKLENVQVRAQAHYQRGGRPAKDATPTHHTYHLQATLVLQPAVVAEQQRRAGRFILATNVLASPPPQTEAGIADVTPSLSLTASQALGHYKAQQGSERGFRFLKDPLFFASSVFLKDPARVAALGLVMGLCLLVYNLGQRALRQALAAAQATIPNQLGQPTSQPTLRWVFQCLMAVHLLVIQGVKQVTNLTAERLWILRFFGSACRHYYLLC